MKKAILSLLLVGASCAAFAQVETDPDRVTIITTRDYSAYGTVVTVPTYVETYFLDDYPASTDIMWWESGNLYHATFLNNGRYNHVYYSPNGTSFTVSLPVTQNFVPDDIMNRAASMYGPMVYDITTLRGVDGQNVYQVRLLQKGQLISEWIDENGNRISDPFRTDIVVDMSDSNTIITTEGQDVKKMKIKTEYADGTETKTKIKDGEVKKKDE